MKITRAHAEYWTLKKAPQWLAKVYEPSPTHVKLGWAHEFDINALIPSNLPDKIQRDCDWHNLIQSLKTARRSGEIYRPSSAEQQGTFVKSSTPMRDKLANIITSNCITQKRRKAIAQRLLKRYLKFN